MPDKKITLSHVETQIVCRYCEKAHPQTALLCDDCGRVLQNHSNDTQTIAVRSLAAALQTRSLEQFRGSGVFASGAVVYIAIERMNTPLIRQIGTSPLIFGRAAGDRIPDIDLEPHGAQERGISRTHAALRAHNGTLLLEDLGSVNGTFVNLQRLTPGQVFPVRDGDTIHIANLMMWINF